MKRLNERGASLLIGLMMVSALTLALSAYQVSMQGLSHGSKRVELNSDLVDLRTYVTRNSNCPIPSCVPETFIELKSDAGTVVIANPSVSQAYTQVGTSSYFLRAKCEDCTQDKTCSSSGMTKRAVVEFMRGRAPAASLLLAEPIPFGNSPNTAWLSWSKLFDESGDGYWCLAP